MSSSILSTSQPASLVEAIKKAAELEGLSVSQWVGAACLGALTPQEKELVADRAPVGFPAGKKKTFKKKKRSQVKRKAAKSKATKRSKVGRPVSESK
jgi:hypothetical protein